MIHIVNEAEVDVFLEFSCFFYDPMDVGDLISGSSVFSFLLHVEVLGSHTVAAAAAKSLQSCPTLCNP